jgi:tRNA-specific 2-thiouridylase
MAKIMVAMSGGVDSSLAAALLHEQGHDVTGVTMHLWEGDDEGLRESQCCSLEMTEGARRVCRQLGVPYYVFNYQREFRRHVIQYFVGEYAHGYTPNPCLACNRDLKFRFLLERAQALGFDALATGHFARVEAPPPDEEARGYRLLRGVDAAKDQSYVLYMLGQAELPRVVFPLGAYTKAQVREMAAERGLATAHKPESQDICFIPDNDYRRFLREELPESLRPGPIMHVDGRMLGTHSGLPNYTIGQRKGLGVQAATPLFVTALDTESNTLVVGPSEAIQRHELLVEQVRSVAGGWPARALRCGVQIRAHAQPCGAEVTPLDDGRLHVRFDLPQRAVTPGQAAVLYEGEAVLGGGRIAAGLRSA